MMPPRPTSTLFPYTTLFRSPRLRHDGLPRNGDLAVHRPARQAAPRPRPRWPGADRKSTRLNSSHVSISYAVFCLKKKKKPLTHDVINRNKHRTTKGHITTDH